MSDLKNFRFIHDEDSDDPRMAYTTLAKQVARVLEADAVVVFVRGGNIGHGLGCAVRRGIPDAEVFSELIEAATEGLKNFTQG